MSTISHNPELLATMRAELEAVIDTYVSGRTSATDRAVARQAMAHAAGYLIATGPDVAGAPTRDETGTRIARAAHSLSCDAAGRAGYLVALWDFKSGRVRR